MISAIAFFASSRRNGNTGQLMDCIARGVDIEVIDLAELEISEYDYKHRNRNDDFEPLMKRALSFDQLIFATPVYWYSVAPPMKVFLDRITDFLELPDLLAAGRRLRGKTAYVVCTSIYDEAPAPFMDAFLDTFTYLGMRYGGMAHANCRDGYIAAKHDTDAAAFAQLVRSKRRAPLSRIFGLPMAGDDLLTHLHKLEVALHQRDVRSDIGRLDHLLHDSFVEFGRSGRSYCKADILRELPLEKPSDTVWSQDFSLAEIADGVALLTYKAAHLNENGELYRHTLRSSLWQRTARGWQMRFHQGTPTDVFAKNVTS